MKYKLNDYLHLCGFKNLPFAMLNSKTANYQFFDKESFELIYRIAAHNDIDADKLNKREKKLFDELIKAKAISEVAVDTKDEVPFYFSYPNHVRTSVQWSITGKCNFKCKHCFQSAPHAQFGEPTLEQCLEIIRQMKEAGILSVGITGGEPLIRKDFFDIIDALIKADIKITTIYSNGWLINEKLLDEFDKRHIHPSWQISFDGIGTHDFLRGVDGAENKTIEAIKLLISRGYIVGSAYSLYRGNTETFINSLKLLGSLGVNYCKTGYTSPQGEFANHPELQLSEDEQLEFYKKAIPEYLRIGRPLSLQCEGLFMGTSDKEMKMKYGFHDECDDCSSCDGNPESKPYRFLINADRGNNEEMVKRRDVCGVLRQHLYISPQGNVLPCMSIDGMKIADKFPNIFKTPLKDILSDSFYIEATNYRVKDYWQHNKECETCEHRLKCLAGCRAMALNYDDNDYLALDKRTCLLVKQKWAEQIEACIKENEKK